MDKLKMQSNNLVEGNVEKLRQLFPNCITEAMQDGKLTNVVDFDLLRQELSSVLVEGKDERYRLDWAGKRQAILTANSPIAKTLRPCREESVNFDTTENLYIEGDNLDVLKLLHETYLNKVKMIYIDPPYNTGNDFVYNDNFAEDAEEYLINSNQKDEQGNRMSTNKETSGRYHSDWLSMMYMRLKLAKDLLTDDGVIFISIDDNEQANLKRICDEIFDAENYLTTLNIQVRYGEKSINEEKAFKPLIEYIIVYAVDAKKYIPNQPTEEYDLSKFCHRIEETSKGEEFYVGGQRVEVFRNGEWEITQDAKGGLDLLKETWISGSVYTNMSYGQVFQKVVEPRLSEDGLGCLYKVHGRGEDGLGFRYYTGPQREGSTRGKMFSGVPLDRANDIKNGKASLRKKPIQNFYDFSADFGNIRHEGDMPFSSGKKPVKMLKQLINYVIDKDIIVMDFFSGSASTAHAVMQINAEDGGNRKFVMVQIPEIIDEKNIISREGYKSICDIGKERIRRAGNKIAEENRMTAPNLDIGFRVLKLDDSNMKDTFYNSKEYTQDMLLGLDTSIKEDRTAEDILFQIMLDKGVPLSSKIEFREVKVLSDELEVNVKNINNSKLHSQNSKLSYYVVGETGFGIIDLICCLDKQINTDAVKEIAKLQPECCVFLDSGMENDATRTNIQQVFDTYSPKTKVEVL